MGNGSCELGRSNAGGGTVERKEDGQLSDSSRLSGEAIHLVDNRIQLVESGQASKPQSLPPDQGGGTLGMGRSKRIRIEVTKVDSDSKEL